MKRVNLTIDKIAYGGSGIGRSGEVVVFVPFSAPGDELTVKIVEEKKNYWRGEIETILAPSPLRAHARCIYYTGCGGCQLQHLEYPHQLTVKKTVVEDAIRRIGRISPEIHDPAGMAESWHYRNKTQYPMDGRHGLRVGYFERNTHRVIDISACPIHPVEFDDIAGFIRARVKKSDERVYDEKTLTGNLRHLIVRKGFNTGEALVMVVTSTDRLSSVVHGGIDATFPALVGFVQNINPDRTNRILGKRSAILSGRDYFHETVLGKKFKISAASFFQVNTVQTEVLLQTVIDFLAPTGAETVLDLYAGVGTIGIALAPAVKSVTAVEIDRRAVEDGKENIAVNDVGNMSYRSGPVEAIPGRFDRADAIVLDPPRKGCPENLLREMVRLAPEKIVYVSCNPTTLARDLAILDGLGYPTADIMPVDLFPHTYHIEAVAKIVKK